MNGIISTCQCRRTAITFCSVLSRYLRTPLGARSPEVSIVMGRPAGQAGVRPSSSQGGQELRELFEGAAGKVEGRLDRVGGPLRLRQEKEDAECDHGVQQQLLAHVVFLTRPLAWCRLQLYPLIVRQSASHAGTRCALLRHPRRCGDNWPNVNSGSTSSSRRSRRLRSSTSRYPAFAGQSTAHSHTPPASPT